MTVRVRIAPAPSGSIHIGTARTALYNWLFARKKGGAFVLRIEDTDQERARPEHVRSIVEEMQWLGLDYDEGPDVAGALGPYIQSERLPTYAEAAERLTADGRAYRCYCTPEELAERRERARTEHRKPGYDGRCRTRTEAELRGFEDEGRRWVLRFRTPDEGETTIDDAVVGSFTVQHSELEDFAILRQNGFPLYVLGAAVDDALMEITHVIRGQDLQDATPRQRLLLDALGYPVPDYAHIPLVFLPGGKRLRKRLGGGSVEWYREHGYLAQAVINALVLMGTGFGDETILSRDEMVGQFSLEKVNASPAIFNQEKLDWMNGEYIRMLDDAEIADRVEPWLSKAELVSHPPTVEEKTTIDFAAPLIKTRMKRLEEAPDLIRSWFVDVEPDPGDFERVMKEPFVSNLLERGYEVLSRIPEWNKDSIEHSLREVVDELDLKARVAFRSFYVAITGRATSAPLFDAMAAIGRDKSLERLARAQSLL